MKWLPLVCTAAGVFLGFGAGIGLVWWRWELDNATIRDVVFLPIAGVMFGATIGHAAGKVIRQLREQGRHQH